MHSIDKIAFIFIFKGCLNGNGKECQVFWNSISRLISGYFSLSHLSTLVGYYIGCRFKSIHHSDNATSNYIPTKLTELLIKIISSHSYSSVN